MDFNTDLKIHTKKKIENQDTKGEDLYSDQDPEIKTASAGIPNTKPLPTIETNSVRISNATPSPVIEADSPRVSNATPQWTQQAMNTERQLNTEEADQTVNKFNKLDQNIDEKCNKPSGRQINRKMVLFIISTFLLLSMVALCVFIAVEYDTSNNYTSRSDFGESRDIYPHLDQAQTAVKVEPIDTEGIVSTVTVNCPDGQFYLKDSDNCGTCPQSIDQGYDKIQQKCQFCFNPQIYSKENQQCQECPEGNHYIRSKKDCGACVTDQFNGYNKKRQECQECHNGLSGGQYHYNIDKKKCTFCPSDQVYLKSTLACGKCVDKVYNQQTLQCESYCQPGTYFFENTKSCGTCQGDQFYISKTKSCETCREGTFYLKGKLSCGTCEDESVYNQQTKSCQCKIGFVYDNETESCIPCKKGSNYLVQTKTCGTCAQDKVYYEQTMTCVFAVKNGTNIAMNDGFRVVEDDEAKSSYTILYVIGAVVVFVLLIISAGLVMKYKLDQHMDNLQKTKLKLRFG